MLVVQSFGKETEYRRAILTIQSYYVHCIPREAGQTYLFTDDPSYFQKFLIERPIRFFYISPEKIKNMRGDIDFLHRMKIAIIEESFLASNENLLYADSDTFFTSDPSPLMNEVNEHVSFMHLCEYRFDSLLKIGLPAGAPFHAFVKCILENKFLMPDGSALKVMLDQYSWNAGVMMLDRAILKLLPEVYALTDYFLKPTQNHASEQYAFSVILQNSTDVRSCDKVIYHYWYRVKKEIMDQFLSEEITLKWSELTEEKKETMIKEWTKVLPSHIDNHILMLRDNAIQSFHENKFKEGYWFAAKAIAKKPFSLTFAMDVLFHTKRWIRKRIH